MRNPLKKMLKVFLPTCLGLFLFGSIASAHVTVAPKTSTTGAWETYTVKVPVEKEIPTTKLTMKAPAGVEIMSYQPVPGWKYSEEKDAAGKVTTFTFEATGEGILPGQFQSFIFVAKNPDHATKATWDAFQYYKDGSVVEWTGDEGADTPHSITDIVAGTSTDHHDSHSATQQDEKTKTEETKTTSETTDSLPLILSVISVLLSLVAVILVIRKK
ncbi:YcnI family protein [Neobacillus novalis]|uniref:YcnI family protein n=1 Tax=Neobacillus novalis TaxID=220687 RepID=A0AA95MM22_9BACI|nr:YcnI family protein [Neobacillus novalis]WHY85667.1 YcnI family protein [Neobacillus novalis]